MTEDKMYEAIDEMIVFLERERELSRLRYNASIGRESLDRIHSLRNLVRDLTKLRWQVRLPFGKNYNPPQKQ